ncbi:MAG: hypothetical protein J7M39_11175, partial [Anaerolineae bacterium]|nr:hypothetical protein [Anaerolineae bacterium]
MEAGQIALGYQVTRFLRGFGPAHEMLPTRRPIEVPAEDAPPGTSLPERDCTDVAPKDGVVARL